MKSNESNREKIMNCAIGIIKSEGIRAVNVSRIVNSCKISKTTFYKYFSSSEELISCIKQESNIDDANDETFYSMRQIIIQKAVEAFSQSAFHTIELHTIAKATGLKRTSIYNYFSSKEELLVASFKLELDNRKKFNQSMKDSPFEPVIYIKKILDYGVSFSTNKYNNLMLRNVLYYSSVNDEVKKVWDETYAFTEEIIREYFERGKAEGIFKEDIKIEALSKLILSCYLGISISIPEQYDILGGEFIELFIIPLIKDNKLKTSE